MIGRPGGIQLQDSNPELAGFMYHAGLCHAMYSSEPLNVRDKRHKDGGTCTTVKFSCFQGLSSAIFTAEQDRGMYYPLRIRVKLLSSKLSRLRTYEDVFTQIP